jgi:hypothetical protein
MIAGNDALPLQHKLENRPPVGNPDLASVMNNPLGVEHRKHRRHPVRFTSTFSTDGVRMEDCVVLDLSLGGCRITSDVPVPSNTPIELHIVGRNHDTRIRISRAMVRWVGDSAFGVEFNELPELESLMLTRLLWSLPC